jgi:hypothetical protein
MRHVIPFLVVLCQLAPATAQTLAVDAEPAPPAPSAVATPPAPSSSAPSARQSELSGWMGAHLLIGAGEDWTRGLDQLAVLPALDFSWMIGDVLRVGYRFTHGALSLTNAAGEEIALAQTVRTELAVAIESDVGPYVGARIGIAHTWDLPADANGSADRTSLLLGADAGLVFRLDPLRLGLNVSYLVEPDASWAVVLGLEVMGHLIDVP